MTTKNEPISQETSAFRDDYWMSRGSRKLLTYIGPALRENLERQEAKKFVRKKGAWGAMWNYDHDYTEQGQWYRCICDNTNYNESEIQSKNSRHNLRRGLKRCIIRRVDFSWLADNAYEVYIKAACRYKNFRIESRENFQEQMRSHSHTCCRDAWGVFVGDKLVAYMTLFIHGQSAFGDIAHFDPAYSKAYPMYVLYYTVARHYLREKGLKEFSRGTRPLVHVTNVDDFLLRLGYRKSYCRLGLYLVWQIRVALCLARPFREISELILPSRYYAILEGLLLSQDIAEATRV